MSKSSRQKTPRSIQPPPIGNTPWRLDSAAGVLPLFLELAAIGRRVSAGLASMEMLGDKND